MTQPAQTPGAAAQPVIIAPVTAPARAHPLAEAFSKLFTRSPRKKHKASLQHLIEHKLETPVFFVVTFTMITRAAQLFSGGALVMSALLGRYYPAFEIVTGLGLGLGSEMLMTIAGRSWRAWENEATDTAARTGMSKVAKDAYKKRAQSNASHSKLVMFVGMGASLFAGLSYLFSNSGKPITAATLADPQFWINVLVDLVAVTVVTTTVFYLGVLKESRGMSEAEEAISELDEGLNDAVKAAIARFREGKQTPTDEKLIAEHLSPGRKAKFLRSVAKVNKGKVWTSGELRKRLGYGNDATRIRKLNTAINALAKEPDNGLEKAADGRTWLIPVAVIWETWGDEIARHDAALLAQAQLPAQRSELVPA
jgi:hypothetical protein